MSECPSEFCGATNPKIFPTRFDSLPAEVQEELKKRGWDKYDLKHCGYCGDVWVEFYDTDNYTQGKRKIIIGIDNHVGGQGMIWKILKKD